MKKLIFLLLLLLFATPCFGQQQEARVMQGVIGGGVPAGAGGCTTDQIVLNTNTVYSGEGGENPNIILCKIYTALCTGTVTKALFYDRNGYSGNLRMAIYTADGTARVGGQSDEFVDDAVAGWKTLAFSGTQPSLTKDTAYNLCIAGDNYTYLFHAGIDPGMTFGTITYSEGMPSALPSMDTRYITDISIYVTH